MSRCLRLEIKIPKVRFSGFPVKMTNPGFTVFLYRDDDLLLLLPWNGIKYIAVVMTKRPISKCHSEKNAKEIFFSSFLPILFVSVTHRCPNWNMSWNGIEIFYCTYCSGIIYHQFEKILSYKYFGLFVVMSNLNLSWIYWDWPFCQTMFLYSKIMLGRNFKSFCPSYDTVGYARHPVRK